MDAPAPVASKKEAARPRRWRRWLIGAGLTLIALVALLPTIASWPPLTRLILGQVNAMLTPAKIELRSAALGWTGPITARDVELRGADGATIVKAPTATLDRGLWSLLWDRPRYGTITFEGADVALERQADGSINLIKAFDGLMGDDSDPDEPMDPELSVGLKVVGGTLHLTTPELAEPLVAERLDLDLALPAGSGPLAGTIALANAAGDQTLDLAVAMAVRTDSALTVDLLGKAWPIAVASGGMVASGQIDGTARLAPEADGLRLSGDLKLAEVQAAGEPLRGDVLRWQKADATWDLSYGATGLQIHAADITTPAGHLRVSNPDPDTYSADARIDLAALSRQAPHALHLVEGRTIERGSATIKASMTTLSDRQIYALDATLSDLAARDGQRAFVLDGETIIKGKITRAGDRVSVETLAAKSPFLDLKGSGDLQGGAKLQAILDLGQIQQTFGALIDFGAVRLAGRAGVAASCQFDAAGTGYQGWIGVELRGAAVAGLTEKPISRQAVRLDLKARGPIGTDRLPNGLTGLEIDGKAGPERLRLLAEAKPDHAWSLGGSAVLDLPWQEGTARVDGRFALNYADPKVDVTTLAVQVTDPAPRPTKPALSLAARGSFDRTSGEVRLLPAEANKTIPDIIIAEQGLMVSGLAGPDAPIVASGGLQADLMPLLAWLGGTPLGQSERIDIAIDGTYDRAADLLTLRSANVAGSPGKLEMAGTIAHLTGDRTAQLSGTLAPDDALVTSLVRSYVDPQAELAVGGRPFRLAGPLGGADLKAILAGLDAEIGLDLKSGHAFGLTLEEPTAVVVTAGRGKVQIAPIRTKVNGGVVDVQPRLPMDDPRGLILRLAPGSKLQDIAINDQVSRQLLSYIAPVMHEATRVGGKVSLDVKRFLLPLSLRAGEQLGFTMQGEMRFTDVACTPGPVGRELLSVAGQSPDLRLALKRPIALSVADRKVTQSGLELPMAPGLTATLSGSVGFDQRLQLQASVPVTAAMLGRAPAEAGRLLEGTNLTIPIGGTLSRPALDQGAIRLGLRQAGEQVLTRGARAGAGRLLDDLLPDEAASKTGREVRGLVDELIGGDPPRRP